MVNLDRRLGRQGATAAVEGLSWRAALLLNLAPGAAAFAAALVLAPLMRRLELPTDFALVVASALVVVPIEVGLLLRAAHRATGRWALRALPAVITYRQPVGRWWLLVPVLLVIGVGAAVGWTPVGDLLGAQLAGLFPQWLLPSYDASAGHPTTTLVTILLISLVVDGVLTPTVEELYFRGYLLPRLPVHGWLAVPVSAALFSAQHYWQPYNWVLIFALQVLTTSLVVRSRSVRLGIVLHVLANCLGIAVALVAVVTSAG